MITIIITHVLAFVVGAVLGIFFYRNNEDKVSPYVDITDEAFAEAKRKAEESSKTTKK